MTKPQEEFEFRISGIAGLMTFSEIDQELKDKLQGELDRIEKRICEVIDVRPVNKGLPGQSLGKMPLHDVMIKFR